MTVQLLQVLLESFFILQAMAEIDVLKAQIVRQDSAVDWGLTMVVTISGGTSPHLAIQRVKSLHVC